MKKFINEKIKSFTETVNYLKSQREPLFFQFFEQYVKEGKERFKYTTVLWEGDPPEEVEVTIFNVIDDFMMRFESNSIVDFSNDKISYADFLSGFSLTLYYQILHLKKEKFAPAVLGTDLSLHFMLALTYFPNEADLIGIQLVKILTYHEEKKANHHMKITGEFGLSSTVYLASFLADYYNKNELAEQIRTFCKKDIQPSYQNAIQNLVSEDEKVVTTWANEMVKFHIKNSKDNLTLPFNHEKWQYFPIEIISLLELRLRKGLAINFIENNFLQEFIPHLGIVIPIELDEFTQKLKSRVMS